jgi:alkylhydroperoxidase/carboxymuconolactone decarboxylase family protein YurZ
VGKRAFIAVGVGQDGRVWDANFELSPHYTIYDQAGVLVEKRANPHGVGGTREDQQVNPQLIVDLLPDCGVFIARDVGKPRTFAGSGVEVVATSAQRPQVAVLIHLEAFETVDVRELHGNFLPTLTKKAAELSVGQGLHVIQSFEPAPLYAVMETMGFEHETVQEDDQTYHVYFYRVAAPVAASATPPLQPLGILKFKQVDAEVAGHMLKVWERIYQREDPAIDAKTLYLIAWGVGIGAGRMRQATRELIKAYAAGATVEELDEIYALVIWLEGASTFVSEISTSPAFGAYMLVKQMTEHGEARQAIVAALMEKFGEQHPEVGIFK